MEDEELERKNRESESVLAGQSVNFTCRKHCTYQGFPDLSQHSVVRIETFPDMIRQIVKATRSSATQVVFERTPYERQSNDKCQKKLPP